jgi:molecular chaperone GrpE (heat shock protein)
VTEHRADAGVTLEEQLAALEAERDEHLNDLKRVAAEFENYRKRVATRRAWSRAPTSGS